MSRLGQMRKLLLKVVRTRNLARKEAHGHRVAPLSAAGKWKLRRRGFFSVSHILYSQQNRPLDDFVSDYQENVLALFINGPRILYLDNKLLFQQLASPVANLPPIHGMIFSGRLYPFDDRPPEPTLDLLRKLVDESGGLFIKPIDGSGGNNVHLLTGADGHFQLDGREIEPATLSDFFAGLDNYYISERVRQGEFASSIYPRTTNTARVLTMIDPQSGEPFIAAAALRIGTDRSFPVDNCAAGGLTAGIDLDTGTLGKGTLTYPKTPELPWYSSHPDSGGPIEGRAIPNWGALRELSLTLARRFAFLPYVGWDFIIGDDNFVLIEGNDGPDLKLHQVHKPLLADPRVRNFYRHYHIVK